jgi:signal transduction histidine kinase
VSRSLVVLAVAAALAAGVAAAADGAHAALVTAALVAVPGAACLAAAHALVAARRRFRSLRREFAFAAAVAVGLVLITVIAVAGLMFVSHHDALLISAIVVAAGLIALRTASLASGAVVADIGAVRDALGAVGEGARDVTAAVDARDEIGDLARAASAMAQRLGDEERRRDSADAARRRLVAAVSHDLRTPVTALRLLVEAVDDDIVDAETRRRYFATMHAHIGALSAMIDDLFELSRIEAGDIEWSIARVELAGLVTETVEAMAPEARAKGVDVRSEMSAAPLAARGDAEKIQRVLFNLIRNAIRHTPADGSVVVRAELRRDAVEVEVADTGSGIPDADKERVFEPFFRGGADAARASDGAGLGLAIARAIVETHGGRIWLSAAERGPHPVQPSGRLNAHHPPGHRPVTSGRVH